ncbi:protein takeout [Fopius arisanus]|uniref:Anon-3B1.2_5 protein n=1 Tax=Fopius arisanus TaxID=64838 RepID=A0A0C9QKV1_9HYME|nr:PREDICTED: protein takeout-like [Fopius arisanus]
MTYFTTFVLITLAVTAIAKDLPEFLHVCKRNDPNINDCIKNSVEHLRPYLLKGVPEYQIPSIEPLLLKEIVAAEGGGLKLSARDVNAYGASDFSVTKMDANMATFTYFLNVFLPHLSIDGQYEIDGKVILLPITGSGRITGNFTDCLGAVKFIAGTAVDNGVEYFRIKEFDLKITVGKGSLRLDNLFGGDKVIGDVVNNAINNNFDAFLKELMPVVEKALGVAFREIGQNIVNQFTFDQLFPLD